ncbi:MAG: PH domain-containing protein [Halobacteriales archaeon]|nr:PH domain-containing protein [Halobacteriales archaeon]
MSTVEPSKLHPVSILYRTLRQLGRISFLVFLFFFGGTGASEEISVVLIGVVAVVVGFVVVLVWQVAYYRRFEYEITGDTFDIRSGVISRRNREIPLRRVQNVDVTENVIHRLIGIAQVNIETAGGDQSEAMLRYVGAEKAREIQRDVRRRKKELSGEETVELEEEEDRSKKLYEISGRELLLLSTFSIDFRLVAFAFFVLSFVPPERLGVLEGISVTIAALPIAVLGLLVALVLWIIGFGTSFSRYYGFVLTRIDDTLGYERGLFNRYSGSIPLDKIQTFTLDENVLKRRFDYSTLGVETAGYSPTQSRQQGSETAVPFAKIDRVMDLAVRIGDVENPEFTLPPKRARRRYAIRYTLILGALAGVLYVADIFVSPPDWYLPLLALPLVPVAAHLKWCNRGYYLGDGYAATRNGFWNRTTVILPYYRVQNVIESSTVLQRRWRLATVTLDTAGSSGLRNDEARAVDMGFEDAEMIREKARERLQESLAERRAERREERRKKNETWLDTVARESPEASDDES